MPHSTQSSRFWHEVLAVAEVARRGDGEDAQRAGQQIGPVAAKERHHLGHSRHAVFGERAGHHRPAAVGQAEVEPPRVGNRRGHVVGGEGRREVGDVLQPVGQPHVVDEIGRPGWAQLAGRAVEHVQPAGAGHEMHAVAGQRCVRLAGAVVEGDRRRRGRDGLASDVFREQQALAAGIRSQSCLQHPGAQLRTATPRCRPAPVRAPPHRRCA